MWQAVALYGHRDKETKRLAPLQEFATITNAFLTMCVCVCVCEGAECLAAGGARQFGRHVVAVRAGVLAAEYHPSHTTAQPFPSCSSLLCPWCRPPLCRYANQNGLLDLGLMRSSHNPVRGWNSLTCPEWQWRERGSCAVVVTAAGLLRAPEPLPNAAS